MNDDLMAGCILVLVFTILTGGLFMLVTFADLIECRNKYGSFENKYGVFAGCQIKITDKWIPAESYYFKEEQKWLKVTRVNL